MLTAASAFLWFMSDTASHNLMVYKIWCRQEYKICCSTVCRYNVTLKTLAAEWHFIMKQDYLIQTWKEHLKCRETIKHSQSGFRQLDSEFWHSWRPAVCSSLRDYFLSFSGSAEPQKGNCFRHFVITRLVSYQSSHLCSCLTFLEHLGGVFHSEAVGCACFVSFPWMVATLAQSSCAVLCRVPCPVQQSGTGLHPPSCSLF